MEKSEEVAGSIASTGWSSGDSNDAASRVLLVGVAFVLAWLTWAHWGDIQIDCGRELYVPTEILRGKLIYRDIFYPYGPLAPYAGALLISLFGPSLNAFYLFGLAITIGCALLLFEIGVMLDGRVVGLTAALALLFEAFAPTIFNFIFPYAYAATLGLLLSLLCAFFALRYVLRQSIYELILAGAAAGFAMLSKQEFGVACYFMLAVVILMKAGFERSIRAGLQAVAACAPGIVPWVAIYGWFFWTLTPAFMINANWIGTPGTYSMRVYAPHLYSEMGQRLDPTELATIAAADIACLLLWFYIAKASIKRPAAALGIVLMFKVLFHFLPFKLAPSLIWAALIFPRGMFLIGCAFIAYTAYELFNSSGNRKLLMAEMAFGVFALTPSVRILANIEPIGYSIYYATPLFLVFISAVAKCIRVASQTLTIERQRTLVNYLLAAEIVMIALVMFPRADARTTKLETSWGAIYLTPEDASRSRQIIDFMLDQKQHGQRVAVVPEAPVFYAFTGTQAPSRWYTILPGILSPSQEIDYLADLKRVEPAYIVLTARNTIEYGAPYFGIDWAQNIYRWIESRYRVSGQFGRFRRDGSRVLAALLYARDDLRQTAAPSRTVRLDE